MGLNDAVVIKIIAAGKPLDLSMGAEILEFSYEDVQKGTDLMRVIFADPVRALADSEQFCENTEMVVQWGFAGNLRPPRKVHLKRPKVKHGKLEICGMDKGASLKNEEKWDILKNQPFGDIVQTIAKNNGLQAVVSSELTQLVEFFAWGGRTDYQALEYLQTRAEDHFFKFIGDKLFFLRHDRNAAPVGNFNYAPGRESRLLDYDVTVKDPDNAKAAKQSTSVSVDMDYKKAIFSADESNHTAANQGNRRPHDTYGGKFLSGAVPYSGGTRSSPASKSSTGKSIALPHTGLKQWHAAAGLRNCALDNSVEANFEILADPSDPHYKPGDLINVTGIGKKFSGSFRITKIMHDLSGGYRYKMQCKRNAINSTSEDTLKPISGPINLKGLIPALTSITTMQAVGSLTGILYGSQARRL